MRPIDANALRKMLVDRQITTQFFHPAERNEIGCIIDLLDSAPTIDPESLRPQWIPVTERLPDPFQTVLTYEAKHDTIQEAYITNHKEWVGVIISGIVTHWKERSTPKENNYETDCSF